MGMQVLTLDRFNGGWATDIKEGPKGSMYYSRHLDFRKKPSTISALPRPTSVSPLITDLPIAAEQVATGEWYIVGNSGRVYKRATNGTITLFGTITGDTVGMGLLYREDADALYITGQQFIHEISPINNPNVTATLKLAKYGNSKSVDTGATATGGAQTYSVPTAITESSTNLRSFVSDIEPLYSIKVKIVAKGTGNWTLTLHDGPNNLLATSTVANSSITNGQLTEFVFATPVRLLVKPNGRTYHFHLTSSVNDGTVQTATASDLSTADFEIWASRMVVPRSGFHPAGQFLQYNMFGNGRYLSQWEPLTDVPSNLEYLRHKLTLPPSYEINSMAQWQQYWCMGAGKYNADGTAQGGIIFLWDGTAATYNDYVNVPQGIPYSLYTDENGILNFYAAGAHYQYNGGNQATKIRTFRFTDSEYSQAKDTTVIYPSMMTTRRSVLLLGYPSQTTNPNLHLGVYSYGQIDANYPKSFGYSYSISTDSRLTTATNNLRIGLVKNFGDTLMIGWRDDSQPTGSKFGLDIIDNYSTPYALAVAETLIFDNGKPWKKKYADALKLQVPTLPTGAQVRVGYKLDRATTWTYGGYITSPGENYFGFAKKPFREIQFRIEISTPTDGTVTTAPEVTSVSFQFDDNQQEQRFK